MRGSRTVSEMGMLLGLTVSAQETHYIAVRNTSVLDSNR